ncbi:MULTISPECIES: carbohydrate ABC transporter permease [Priestia]|jgi:raffinose/stachyose/melibiose transport system permease protein|uniref:Sugar ABC transporter permease n=6 Tax=Priestia TaxID=2800373 RepID=A0A1Q8UN83_PRIMG|nr:MULTISPECIES: sugar ABC transporter permease [Priestia]AVX08816.1 sugar ABC transporter permease [Bacillus sp. Y-01]KOP74956.1 ABC transporter permease [Bacillus sp. FJAT-21351]KQU11835.1 ABC transporter permease [Bacillus sp. Leaf75]KRF56246.1 ABC transporter permease [Bacillus sp. Soil531]MBU8852367.1 sugar ABC transporter permease [Bacillus sp. FJAT-26377]MBZ5480211.1 sugar ABC transporter permease [Bacillus sp. T_4]MCF6796681.1 sugar ABC transporter permease [Bacillus sp. ET1]MCJ7985
MNSQSKLQETEYVPLEQELKREPSINTKKRKNLKNVGLFALFVGPALLAFCVIVLIPFFTGIYYSFTDWNGVNGTINWVGLDNFKYLFTEDKQFQQSFWITTKYTVVAIILTNVVGFVLAILVTQMLKTRNILRTVFFMPNLIGGLLLGFVWQFIFVKGFASIGQITGISLFELPWLGDAKTAFWGIVIVSVWQGAGYIMLIYTAALQNVPQELIEAAKIDGASRWQILRHITIPMVAPAVTVCLFLTISWSFKVFDVNLSLTNGGPFKSTEMLALNIYTEAFVNNRYGLGEAKALIFFIVVAAITIIQVTYTKKKEVES